MTGKWEYKATYVLGDEAKLNQHLNQMAQDGWELVNGSTATYLIGSQWHTQATQYWRRPVS